MSDRVQRAQLRAERDRLRAQARSLRASLKARVEEQLRDPAFAPLIERRRRARRRRRVTALVIALLLLLLLLIDCEPEPAAVVPEDAGVAALQDPREQPEKKKKKKRVAKRVIKPFDGKLDGTDRSSLAVDRPAPPPWLPQFRMQVAARSPRLAACFNASEEPGAMRWTTLVHAQSGRVSDSEIEPVFRGVSIDEAQRECLLAALSEPSYGLKEPDPEAVARRVSLIFEF